MQVVWAIIVGAIAGFIARWISPSPNNPQGFVLTTVLGIVGSVVATFLGRAIHLYGPDQSAGTIAVSVSRWPPTGLAGCRVRLVRAGSVHDRLSGHYLLDCDLEGCRDECDWVDLLK